MDANLGPLGP